MFSNRSANNKALAVAFVTMLVVCSFAAVLTDESDAANNNGETYDIYMRTGDVFTYTPAVNLKATNGDTVTMAAEGTAFGAGLLQWKNGTVNADSWQEGYTLTGSFVTSGERYVKLTATWTSGDLTQTATQTINFHVYDHITLASGSGDQTKGFTIGDLNSVGKALDTVVANSGSFPAGGLTYSAQIDFVNADEAGGTNNLLEYDTATNEIKTKKVAEAADEGTYTITVTASYTSQADNNSNATGLVTDTDEFTYTVKVGQNLVIDSETDLKTYVGNTTEDQNKYTITTNYDGEGIEFTYDVQAPEGYIDWTENTNTFTVDTTAAAACISEGQTSGTFNVDITVSGDVDDDDTPETATTDVTVTVFAALVFTSDPEIEGTVGTSATGNPLDMLATANFEGTNRIVYNWGDGTSTTVNVTPDSGSKFSARHVYSTPGTYAVVITAYNDVGNTKAIMLYDATNGAWAEGTEDDVPAEEQSFFEEHGVLFILFAVLAIVMFLLYFAFGVKVPYVLIAGIVFVILTVACFLGADFGLTEGLIEDLNI